MNYLGPVDQFNSPISSPKPNVSLMSSRMAYRHPNFAKIEELQAEIMRLSNEVAGPLVEHYFVQAFQEMKLPNVSKMARMNGVTQTWLQKRISSDTRYAGLIEKIRAVNMQEEND